MVTGAGTFSLDGDRLRFPSSAFTLEGFRAWMHSPEVPEKLRATFVNGEVLVAMSPESIETHNKVKTAISARLWQFVEDEDLGEVYTDGVLFTHPDAQVSTEPDFIFASWATLQSGRLRKIERVERTDEFKELEGTPDLVVEVVSDSSTRKDLKLLRDAYALAGIPEYWLVDARGDELRFEILTLTPRGYTSQEPAAADTQTSAVLGCSLALRRVRNRVGGWRYLLDVIRS
ncbi:MAG: Uma2 family endonuclease [Myxococcota bacterium]